MGLGQIMTLANSIIGVSVLAMPFCFKQCGIILSILILFLSSIMTRLACHFLLKAAVLARRRNYEFLAFHAFGPKGKLMVELCIIGFLFGTCIAFFVVMGDLGPVIISEILDINKSPSIRSSVLIGLALLVVLPLGLLRNVDSLSSLCTATILFYFFLVLKIMSEATTHLLAGDWLQYVHLWRPAGILQCIPIFAMALSCQTQVFEIYESLPDPSLPKMNEVVRAAVNICTGVYVCMGFFGYVAVCGPSTSVMGEKVLPPPPLTGNILMSFPSSFSMQAIKLFFVASIACSFPLVIFPCRASLHSLLFRRAPHHESGISGSNVGSSSSATASLLPPGSSGSQALERIPERRFRLLTICLVAGSLGVAFALPDIELVLGLVGSSIGTITCLLLPALCFLKVAPSHPYHHSRYGGGKGVTAERLLAQVMIILGSTILILSTYANLHAVDQAHTEEVITPHSLHENGIIVPKVPAVIIPPQPVAVGKVGVPAVIPKIIPAADTPEKDSPVNVVESLINNIKKEPNVVKTADNVAENLKPDKRQEPPIPVAPDSKIKKNKEEDKEKKQISGNIKDELRVKPTEKNKISNPDASLSVKEPSEVHDSVHGDAIKKEEEEVVIEEGAAKREQDRLAEEEKKEKERKEKELLEKLADDRKKQQELINVQMEILKKLQELEDKNENEVSEVKPKEKPKISESNIDTNLLKKTDSKPKSVSGTDQLKKMDNNELKPLKSAEKAELKLNANSSVKELFKGIENETKLSVKSENKPDKKVMLDVKKPNPNVIEKLITPKKEEKLGKNEETRAVNVSAGDINHMKAAVPMPLLLVGGPQNSIFDRKVGKPKEREKREALEEEEINRDIGNVSEKLNDGQNVANNEILEHSKNVLDQKKEEASMKNVMPVGESEKITDTPSKESPTRESPIKEANEGSLNLLPRNEVVAPSEEAVLAQNLKNSKENLIAEDKVSSFSAPCPLVVRDKGNFVSPTIQVPNRLSNPVDEKTPSEKVDCDVNLEGVAMESMPLKRDLKFVEEITDEGKRKSPGLA